MATPLVSFVIPVFNSEKDIARCLLSIRQQDFPAEAYEVLIMDNGSTDQTHQIMRDLGFSFQVIPRVNVSTLRNRGAALAQGEYIAFVDSDVELVPGWLQHGLPTFVDQQIVACGCFPGIPKESTWVQRAWDVHQRGSQCDATQVPVSWLASMNLIVRRDTFLAVAGFNENLETAEDVDLCYRLGQHGVILRNCGMAAIHWGEARDLRTFWRKEVWRGLGNWHGVLSHGWRWDELPSLGYPLYTISLLLLSVLGIVSDVWQRHILLTPPCFLLLSLPPLVLAVRTTRLAHCLDVLPQLFLLYLVYGIARAYALMKNGASWLA